MQSKMKRPGDPEQRALRRDPAALREQAAQCRRLASSVLDRRTYDTLITMAAECEEAAARLEQGEFASPPGAVLAARRDHSETA